MRFLKYLYKHLATTLTLVVTIITAVVVNCNPSISVDFLDNFLMTSIICLNLTFLFDFTRNMETIEHEIVDFKRMFPSSRIETFKSVDQVAKRLTELISSGKHDVDVVLFDTKIRTTDPKKVNKMHDFIHFCSTNRRIKFRLAFSPSSDSIMQRIEDILVAEKRSSNSFYAYQESKLTFASFMIIDNSYISIRTPHKDGSPSLYCIVKEENLCVLYSSWFEVLWNEATHIQRNNLVDFINLYANLIPSNIIEKYKKDAEGLIS